MSPGGRSRHAVEARRARDQNRRQRQGGRDAEQKERERHALRPRDDHGDNQRSDDGAGLIHDGVQPESPAMAHHAGSLREQHVAGRPA